MINIERVTEKLQRSYREATEKLQRSYREVTKKLQRSLTKSVVVVCTVLQTNDKALQHKKRLKNLLFELTKDNG